MNPAEREILRKIRREILEINRLFDDIGFNDLNYDNHEFILFSKLRYFDSIALAITVARADCFGYKVRFDGKSNFISVII